MAGLSKLDLELIRKPILYKADIDAIEERINKGEVHNKELQLYRLALDARKRKIASKRRKSKIKSVEFNEGKIIKNTIDEHYIQEEFIRIFNDWHSVVEVHKKEVVADLWQIPNGAFTIEERIKKAQEGTLNGVPDIEIRIASRKKPELHTKHFYFELKAICKGKPLISQEQIDFQERSIQDFKEEVIITNNPLFFEHWLEVEMLQAFLK